MNSSSVMFERLVTRNVQTVCPSVSWNLIAAEKYVDAHIINAVFLLYLGLLLLLLMQTCRCPAAA